MRIRAMLVLGALVATLAVSGISSAHQTYGSSASQAAEVCGKPSGLTKIATPAGETFYLDVRSVAGAFLYSIWIYQEGNNHTGMQTYVGNTSIIDETDLDNCYNYTSGTWLTSPAWGDVAGGNAGNNYKADIVIF